MDSGTVKPMVTLITNFSKYNKGYKMSQNINWFLNTSGLSPGELLELSLSTVELLYNIAS